MDDLGKQLKKGVMEIMVLKLLQNRDSYGYFIIQELERLSKGAFVLKEGTLYPILYRLEDNGMVESYWEHSGSGRKVPKKFYKITDSGRQRLAEMLKFWVMFVDDVNIVLKGI